MIKKEQAIGAAQIGTGAYLGYQGIKHGLPRAAGIRIEYHTTSKANADLIKRAGNILDPAYGGKNGLSAIVHSDSYVNNSANFVHITGVNENSYIHSIFGEEGWQKFIKSPFRTISRKAESFIYKLVRNANPDELKEMTEKCSKKSIIKCIKSSIKNTLFHNDAKTFCIPGIDSYFNQEFIPDVNDPSALKSSKPLQVFTNRFSAMADGIKRFGLKGVKENKGRVAVGLGVVALGLFFGAKLIKKGINNIKGNSKSEQ